MARRTGAMVRAGIAWAVIVLVAGLVVVKTYRVVTEPEFPDFSAIKAVGDRKAAFFGYLYPHVDAANERIAADRARLIRMRELTSQGRMLNKRDHVWLADIAEAYGLTSAKMNPVTLMTELVRRVDEIPVGLAMAQAALESGWGTSRFARQGRNLFGIWCYEPGCGIVPKRRAAGARHEVKVYASATDSLADYMRNLNSNPAYARIWSLRAGMRARGEPLSAHALAGGLGRYSQEGSLYIGKVRSVIRGNQLESYNP